MKKFLTALILISTLTASSQKSLVIMNGTAHLGTDSVIQNAMIGIREGKIVEVIDLDKNLVEPSNYDERIDAKGKHIYPGLISPNSTLGLSEIEAVRATNDFREVGAALPNVRSLIAYNTDSKIIPTVRSNGILLAQITPRGGIVSGTSSVVLLDGWNWEDAAYRIDDGIHINWPKLQSRKYTEDDGGNVVEKNKFYAQQTDELRKLFSDARAYSEAGSIEEMNLRFEGMRGLFKGTQTLYIHANNVKEIIESLSFAKSYSLAKICIVGGRDSWMVTDLLKSANASVMLGRLHDLPDRQDEDVDQPYKLPYLLEKAGVLYCLNNEGDMEAMNTRNLPFLAGTAAAYGLTKEQALKAVTLNTAKILGVDKTTGSIEAGKDANLFISTGDALDMRGNNVEAAFVKGKSIDLGNEQKDLYERYRKKYGIK